MRNRLKDLKSYIAINFNIPWIYGRKSYSQYGEDLFLSSIFPNNYKGFYIDIGAHHPFRYSNTYYFYKLGWRGINVDANPRSKYLFDKTRGRDINIKAYIGNGKTAVKYNMFNDSAFNTSSQKRTQLVLNNSSTYMKTTVKYKQTKLKNILEEKLKNNTPIDFLSIDTEGNEYSVLLSNDWVKYRPKIILVEVLGYKSIQDLDKSNIHKLLYKNSYSFIARITGSSIFKNEAKQY
jgi:FkbM family methyltransferase